MEERAKFAMSHKTSSKDPDNPEDILNRPLYVYDLPINLLASLSLRTNNNNTNNDQQQPTTTTTTTTRSSAQDKDKDKNTISLAIRSGPPTPANEAEAETPTQGENHGAASKSCSLCGVAYTSVQEHRDHARSDHHRYNVKAQLRGNKTLSEAEFAKAIGEIDESISGSETESESSDDDEHAGTTEGGADGDGGGGGGGDSTLVALLRRQAKKAAATTGFSKNENEDKVRRSRQPIVWFSSDLFESNVSLGVYRALFTIEEQDEPGHFVEYLRKKQTFPIDQSGRGNSTPTAESVRNFMSGPHIFMCMIGGGHFAAMVVGLSPEIQKKQGGVEERQARVLAHKTFHRYTTRRKQGGAQSANDASKGNAHSAGSSLRRYNEAALEKEIRELLRDWKSLIDGADLLFIRATGSTNRRTLFGPYEGQVLWSNDPRIRGFPFSTRRATQSELMRCFKELTRVKVSRVDEAALLAADSQKREESSKSPKPAPTKKPQPKLSEEEETAMLHSSQIQALIRRSKAPALLSYITNNNIPPSFTFYPPDSSQNHHSPTPLHLAASSNSPALVTALLLKGKSDPTILNAEDKTPFDLARDRATRDAFRIARHELGEDAWDWDTAHVPAALSKAEVDERTAHEKTVAAEEEATRRKTETERLKKEEEARAANLEARKNKGGKTLGTVEKTASEKREEEMRGMSPEMRMRLERERRARAAEERIKRMQGT